MSKSRGKRHKKKGKKGVPEPPEKPVLLDEPLDEISPPAPLGEVSGNKLDLYALKVHFLGPFLFGQQTLCEKAVQTATDVQLLPKESGMWPVFFEQDQWKQARVIVGVITTTIKLWETNQSFREFTLDTKHSLLMQDDSSLAEVVQLHSEELNECSLQEVEVVFKIVRIHVAHVAVAGTSCKAGETFLQSIAEKEQLVSPIKDRGNVNFKNLRYRAAVADYTRAIKLCPVLYCNRAMSYLKSGNYWCACVDSYRALVLKPEWEKAYYRCAEAWIKLGNVPAAISVNHSGQRLCIEHSDLDRQLKEIQGQSTVERTFPPHPVRIDHQPPKQQQNNNEKTTENTGATPTEKPIEDSGSGPPKKVSKNSESSPLKEEGTKNSGSSPPGKGTGNLESGPTEKSKSEKATEESGAGLGGETTKSGKGTDVVDSDHLREGSSIKAGTESKLKTDIEKSVTPTDSVPKELPESGATNQAVTKEAQPSQVATAGPYDDFVSLQCPIVDRDILTSDLKRYSQEVKLHYLTPAIYTKHSAAWEKYEEEWQPHPKPKTDPASITTPNLTVQFDEIWCPIPADFEPAETILPPTFTYMPTEKCSFSKPDYMIVKTTKVDGE